MIEINLLQQKKDYKKYETIFRYFRMAVIAYGCISMIALVSFFFLKNSAQHLHDSRDSNKEALLKNIQGYNKQEVELVYIIEKMNYINRTLADEQPYYEYASFLNTFAPNATDSGILKGLSMNKLGEATMQIDFPNILVLTGFLSKLETKEFTEKFSSIRLSNVSFSDGNEKKLSISVYVVFNTKSKHN